MASGLECGGLASALVGIPPGRRRGPPDAAGAAVGVSLVLRVGAFVEEVPNVVVHGGAALGRLQGPGNLALAPSHMTKGQALVVSRRGEL